MIFSDTLIKASAGSGKTFQLSNRYLQLIFSGTTPETILATTFTRKAAGEILDRILERLAEATLDEKKRRGLSRFVLIGPRTGETLSQEETLAVLSRLVRNIHRLRVSTLDSFFQQIAANMSLELGMPSGWLIMEEDDRSPLLLEGIRNLLEQLGTEKTVDLMYLLFKGESRSTVTREIDDLLSDLALIYGESTPEAWQQLQRAKELSDGEIERLVYDLAKAEIARTKKGDPNKVMLKARDGDLEAIRNALALDRDIPWETIGGKGICAKVLEGGSVFGRAEIPDSLYRVYQAIVQQVRATVINRLAKQTEATGELLGELTAIVDDLKNRRRLFDFSDVTNRLAKTQLAPKFRQIVHRIDADTRHLLLDEFQDTSPSQWLVLKPFAKRIVNGKNQSDIEKNNATPPETSFFCVGDVKQAIYGWRGGVAEIFDAIETDLGKLDEERLDKSYRSAQPVIDTVNEVFEHIASNAALNYDGADSKKAADYKPITDAAETWAKRFECHQTQRSELSGYCSLRTSYAPEEKLNENGEIIKPTKEEKDKAHLQYVIDAIVSRHEQTPTATIGVLTRTNRMVQRVIFGLRDHGIEASEEGGNPLDQSPAVELMLSALSLTDYPGNRIAAYHLAQSPLGPPLGVTPRNYCRADNMQRVALAIRRRLMTEGYSTVLHDWAAHIAPVCDRRDLGRMMQLLEMASAYQRKAKIRTTPFVNLVRAKSVESPSVSPIRVMSIHKSKGLQFDIVVLPELDAKLTGTRTPKVIAGRESPTDPYSTVLAYPSKNIRSYLPERFQAIAEANETERVEEALCVLYVAMTRAVHELLMILQPKTESKAAKKSNDDDDSESTGKMFDRTLGGVLHAELAARESLSLGDALLYTHGNSNWAVKQFGQTPAKTLAQESTDAIATESIIVTLAKSPSSKKAAKNLVRVTPSSREGSRNADETNETLFGATIETTSEPVRASKIMQAAQIDEATQLAFRWGTATHACFEQVIWLENGLPDRQKLLECVTPVMQNEHEAAKVIDAFYASCELPDVQAALSLQSYHRPVDETDLPSAVHCSGNPAAFRWEVHNERRFSVVTKSGTLLQGIFDRLVLLYETSGSRAQLVGADIIDFKSDKIDNETELREKIEYYAPQLAEYRRAVSLMYKLKHEQISTRLLFSNAGKVVAIR